MEKQHPYAKAPAKAFWMKAAAGRKPGQTEGFFTPKFGIDRRSSQIAAAGSCFAQNIARALRHQAYRLVDEEQLPPGFPFDIARNYGFGLYSARYGNIYTVRQFTQLLKEAFHGFQPENPVWEKDGRFFDSQRPAIDPCGFGSPESVLRARESHLAAVRRVFEKADTVIFTLGLTECWTSVGGNTVYQVAPGVAAGVFDPALYAFHNFTVSELLADLEELRDLLQAAHPGGRLLLSVSPVSKMATALDRHIEVATADTKARLRAAAGEFTDLYTDVDYFPSYEIVMSPASKNQFFDDTGRTVRRAGVRTVIQTFTQAYSGGSDPVRAASVSADSAAEPVDQDLICEEMLLARFGEP